MKILQYFFNPVVQAQRKTKNLLGMFTKTIQKIGKLQAKIEKQEEFNNQLILKTTKENTELAQIKAKNARISAKLEEFLNA